jgi:hypothetical protein
MHLGENIVTERPDLPILIVVSRHDTAERLQRSHNPKETVFKSIRSPLMGLRFRAIYLAIGEYENEIRFAPSKDSESLLVNSLHEYLSQLRCKLAAGCTENFFLLS